MSKKRPGFQASQNLVNADNLSIWEGVELRFQNILESVPNLKQHEVRKKDPLNIKTSHFLFNFVRLTSVQCELVKLSAKDFLNKDELTSVVRWKHTVSYTKNV
jgi:hypothetical protein